MKLAKAIEILTTLLTDSPQFPPGDRRDAVMLSIKTLKLLNEQPPEGYTCIPRPLPGED